MYKKEKLINQDADYSSDYHKNLKSTFEKISNHHSENNTEVTKTSLLSSYIHMSVNRAFRLNQRLYELMVYDFLVKKFKYILNRNGK